MSDGKEHVKGLLYYKYKQVFHTLSLIIRRFTIIYNTLQLYYDKRCSPESWSS